MYFFILKYEYEYLEYEYEYLEYEYLECFVHLWIYVQKWNA
jgi:hypothetical protein